MECVRVGFIVSLLVLAFGCNDGLDASDHLDGAGSIESGVVAGQIGQILAADSELPEIPGTWGVSDLGQATYEIPIQVPHGSNGLAPTLSIKYESSDADGPMGIGFSIHGIEAIERCGRSFAVHGQIDAVDLSARDEFCLNGVPLTLIPGSGAQHSEGFEYRTVEDNLLRVRSYYGDEWDRGPEFFVVSYPDGTTATFGGTLESAPTVVARRASWGGTTPESGFTQRLRWGIRERVTPVGGRIRYQWELAQNGNGYQHVVRSITWGGAGAEKDPMMVGFWYDQRDSRTSYVAGVPFTNARRLTSIVVSTLYTLAPEEGDGYSNVRIYSIDYCPMTTHSGSLRVCSIGMTGRGLDESSSIGSARPTTFEWTATDDSYRVVNSMLRNMDVHSVDTPLTRYMDVNGDGRMDFVLPRTASGERSQWNLLQPDDRMVTIPSNGDGTFANQVPNGLVLPNLISDFQLSAYMNNDDRADAIIFSAGSGDGAWRRFHGAVDGKFYENVASYRSNSSWSVPSWYTYPYTSAYYSLMPTYFVPAENRPLTLSALDVDGNGSADLWQSSCFPSNSDGQCIWPNQSFMSYRLSGSAGDFVGTNGVVTATLLGSPMWFHRVADCDGDGRQEIVVRTAVATHGSHYSCFGLRDDGRIDQTASIPSAAVTYNGLAEESTKYIWLDVNSDGLTDVCDLGLFPGQSIRCSLNTGAGFAPYYDAIVQNSLLAWVQRERATAGYDSNVRVGNLNGDAYPDLLLISFGKSLALLSDGRRFMPYETFAPRTKDYGNPQENYREIWLGDHDGNGIDDIALVGVDGFLHTATHRGSNPNRIERVRSGSGNLVEFQYNQLNARSTNAYGSVYSPGTSCVAPQMCVTNGGYVVGRVRSSDGIGGLKNQWHMYRDARVDRSSRTMIGIRVHEIHDSDDFRREVREFDLDTKCFPTVAGTGIHCRAGHPWRVSTGLGMEASRVEVTVATSSVSVGSRGAGSYYLRPISDSTTIHEVQLWNGGAISNGTLISSEVVEYSNVDAYGLPQTVIRRWATGDVMESTIARQYDLTRWALGLPTSVSSRWTTPSSEVATQYESISYVGVVPSMRCVGSTSSSPKQCVRETRNARGQLIRVEEIGTDSTIRSQSLEYDTALGGMVTARVDSAGLRTEYRVEGGLERVLSVTSPGGDQHAYSWDSFGRIRRVATRAGDVSTRTYQIVGAGGGASGVRMTTLGNDGSTSILDLDAFGRAVRLETKNDLGESVEVVREFNRRGQVSRVSLPGIVGHEKVYDSRAYDARGRLLESTTAGGASVVRAYGPFRVEVSTSDGESHASVVDTMGRVVRTEEWTGAAWTSAGVASFGPASRLKRIVDASGNVLREIGYDAAGRVERSTSIDAGAVSFTYGAFGEVATSTTADGVVQTYVRDSAGRLSRIQSTRDGVSSFFYAASGPGVGQLWRSESGDGVVIENSFDAIGRIVSRVMGVDGRTFALSTTFDSLGRVGRLEFPRSSAAEVPFGVQPTYGSQGQLLELRDSRTNSLIRRTDASDAMNRVLVETLGNGLQVSRTYESDSLQLDVVSISNDSEEIARFDYDHTPIGRLTRRDEVVGEQSRSQEFGYDAQQRLTSWRVRVPDSSPGGSELLRTHSYAYDSYGNLTNNDGVASSFGGSARSIHGIASYGGDTDFTYDAAGRMTRNRGRVIQYTGFDLPRSISVGGVSTNYRYDAMGNRAVRARAGATDYSFEDVFELRVSGGREEYVYKLPGIVQVVDLVVEGHRTTSKRYLHLDAQGSVDLVTDEEGAIAEVVRRSPWGERTGVDGTPLPEWSSASGVRVGFQGHDDDLDTGMVDMGGRIFDPRLAKFMSPDPFLGSRFSRSGFNGYVFAMNRPTQFSDPSGLQCVSGDGISGTCEAGLGNRPPVADPTRMPLPPGGVGRPSVPGPSPGSTPPPPSPGSTTDPNSKSDPKPVVAPTPGADPKKTERTVDVPGSSEAARSRPDVSVASAGSTGGTPELVPTTPVQWEAWRDSSVRRMTQAIHQIERYDAGSLRAGQARRLMRRAARSFGVSRDEARRRLDEVHRALIHARAALESAEIFGCTSADCSRADADPERPDSSQLQSNQQLNDNFYVHYVTGVWPNGSSRERGFSAMYLRATSSILVLDARFFTEVEIAHEPFHADFDHVSDPRTGNPVPGNPLDPAFEAPDRYASFVMSFSNRR